MNLYEAKREVRVFFQKYSGSTNPRVSTGNQGKLYELYCLSETIDLLKRTYSPSVKFVGKTIDFKASPGKIDRSKSYFVLSKNGNDLELHTDIEFQTLGTTLRGCPIDSSAYHEIDLLLVKANATDRPSPDEVVLGVECKSNTNFNKRILKEVLGVRRELSLYQRGQTTTLSRVFGGVAQTISADPPSEYWLAFVDPKGLKYKWSPAVFGIRFHHWCP